MGQNNNRENDVKENYKKIFSNKIWKIMVSDDNNGMWF